MTAIHTREPALTIRAGRRAMQRIKEKPLSPEDVHVIPGAAGGPKALGSAAWIKRYLVTGCRRFHRSDR